MRKAQGQLCAESFATHSAALRRDSKQAS